MLLWAMSLPCWRCRDCRNVVEWCDAIPVIGPDGKLDGFRCGCTEEQ